MFAYGSLSFDERQRLLLIEMAQAWVRLASALKRPTAQ
jgi:hypothetical protein